VILYSGPSLIDGAPIVALATVGTSNRKTGDMVQTWILRADRDPLAASKARLDGSVCGDCPHRWSLDGGCYVNLGQAPVAVWRAWKRGAYDSDERTAAVTAALATGTPLRIGSYGDPMAVPHTVWTDLLDISFTSGSKARWTGYTHRWADGRADAPEYRKFLMASVDTADQWIAAQGAGWRTFRVSAQRPDTLTGDVECVAETHGRSCVECGLCDGTRFGVRENVASVYINPHGARAKRVGALRVVQ